MKLSRRATLSLLATAGLRGQEEVEFLCPMDPDVRQKAPGKCPRCGMKLLAGLPDPVEYPVKLTMKPKAPKPGQRVTLRFTILHPKSKKPVGALETMHEKVFHLFLISEDMEHFAHEHPEVVEPGVFEFDWVFPQGGMWRALCDFFPTGATPQLIPKTILMPKGDSGPAAKAASNIEVELRTEPAEPLAGEKTMLFYKATPREGFEPYLGAMGHMLVASEDLVDLVHTHPFLVDGGLATPPEGYKQIQFNVIFPRAGRYRVWAQFQRAGVVNTIARDVLVKAL